MINNKKGFTLIELLVVVSIIGLLSTMAVVSLNGARKKARDAKRVSDVKQIATLIEMKAANTGSGDYSLDTDCANNGTANASSTCLNIGATGLFQDVNMANIKDPNNTAGTNPACGNAAGANIVGCQYAVASTTPTYFEICFNLEDGAGNLNAGLNRLTNGGTMSSTCSH